MNSAGQRGKHTRQFNNSGRTAKDHRNRNDSENSQRFHQNSGHENLQKYSQNPGSTKYQRGKSQNNSRNQDEVTRNQNAQRSNIPSGVQSAESHNLGASLDSHQNETLNSVMSTDHNTHSTTEEVENYTSSNPVPMDSGVSNEVPREPSVGTTVPAALSYNYKNIRVTGADENFDHVLKRLLDSHPKRDEFLSELSDCPNVFMEPAETQISAISALSVNAPEFQMRADQCSSELEGSKSEFQQPYISDTGAEQVPHTDSKNVKVYEQQSGTDQQTENTVSCDEEEEGAVGGIKNDSSNRIGWSKKEEHGAMGDTKDDNSNWDDYAWDKKDGKDWADEVEEKQNVPTDDKQFYEKKNKSDKWKQNKDRGKQQYKKVKETFGDLFTAPDDNSLAHCVAVDMKMGSGIAVTFKRDFKNLGELMDQRKGVGEVAILEHKDRFIYYLVTKKYSTGKPRLGDLEKSIKEMRDHCVKNGVKKLAMPRIGCGLDRLEWKEVKPMIEEIFSDVDISIMIYNLSSDKEDSRIPLRPKAKFVSRMIPLIDIESETGLVFFGAEDGSMDECGTTLDKKFNFTLDYRKEQKCLGTVLKFEKKNEYIYGLIIKKKESDSLSYINLEKCLIELKKKTKKDNTYFIGFQAFCDGNDELTTEKFFTLLRNVFFMSEVEIHVCYPKNLEYLQQGDEERDSNKNSEETTGNRGQPAGEKKGGYGIWNQQNSNRRKETTSKNWRDG